MARFKVTEARKYEGFRDDDMKASSGSPEGTTQVKSKTPPIMLDKRLGKGGGLSDAEWEWIALSPSTDLVGGRLRW